MDRVFRFTLIVALQVVVVVRAVEIVEHPTGAWIERGQSASFRCVAIGGPNLWFSWKWNDGGKEKILYADSASRKLVETSWSDAKGRRGKLSVLTIVNATERDRSSYTCVASESNVVASDPARIYFDDEIPPFDRGPQNETVVKGSTVRLRCDPPRVVPAPLVYWERDGTILVPDDNLKQTGGELVIKTKRSHSGLYTCVATWPSKSKTTRSRSGKLTVIPKAVGKVVIKPERIVPSLSSRVTLACRFAHDNAQIVRSSTWSRDGTPIQFQRKRFSTENNGQTLVIRRFKLEDVGEYQCTLFTDAGRSPAANARIESPWILPLPRAYETVKALVRKSVILECEPKGEPTPTIEWTLNGKKIDNGMPIRIKEGMVKFTLQASTAGVYVCHARNDAGEANRTTLVELVPMVKTIPKHVAQLLYSPVRIQCTTEEFPEYSTFEWRHNGKTYRNDTGSPRRNVYVEKNGLLVIQQVTAAENGNWTCEANVSDVSMGKAQASIHVEVSIMFLRGGRPPAEIRLKTGETVNLPCNVSTSYWPVVGTWYHDGRLVRRFTLGDQQARRNNRLQIENAQVSASGAYVCVARNAMGKTINTSTQIIVYERPHVRVRPMAVEVYQREDVYLHCNGTGKDVRVRWRIDSLDGLPPSSADRFVVYPNGTLRIRNAKTFDEHRYWCRAESWGGHEEESVDVKVLRNDAATVEPENGGFPWVPVVAVCSAVYVVLTIGLVVWCKRRHAAGGEQAKVESGKTTAREEDCPVPKREKERQLESLSVDVAEIQMGAKLGRGRFCTVYLAHLRRKESNDDDEDKPVIVKEFDRDSYFFRFIMPNVNSWMRFEHENVARLCGVCPTGSHYLVATAYMDQGDLKAFLACKSDVSRSNQVCLMKQVAEGMHYLASQHNFVHKDLAARNCLIDSSNRVQVSDLGLCQEGYSEDYECGSNGSFRPLRWMSPEAVRLETFSSLSDVWSFGVLAWEILNPGTQPYSELSDEEVCGEIEQGNQLVLPDDCEIELCKVIKQCWERETAMRPDFRSLVSSLTEIHDKVN